MLTKQPPFHPIQRAILESLRRTIGTLRYRDMRPPDIENDLYNYHLQYLVQRGLVDKRAGRYGLNESGRKHIIELNPYHETNRFKIASLCLVIQNGKLLYQERKRQPFTGQSGLIGGGITRGELATAAAQRRLREEAGLSADFRLLGLLRKIRIDTNDELYTDILFHVCVADQANGELIETNEFGQQYWIPPKRAASLEQNQAMGSPQFAEVLINIKDVLIKPAPAFYIEEIYRHDIM